MSYPGQLAGLPLWPVRGVLYSTLVIDVEHGACYQIHNQTIEPTAYFSQKQPDAETK